MKSDHDHVSSGYETSDVNFKALVVLMIALIVLVILSMCLSIWMDKAFTKYSPMHDQPESPLARMHQQPPLPRLQPNPGIDMIIMRQHTSEELSTYGWIDRASGQVRIPIEAAMEKVVQEGLPAAKSEDAR